MLIIGSWTDVDRALERIGILELETGERCSSLGRRLYELLGEYSQELKEISEEKKAVEAAVESFCLLNKAEFAKKRSKQFHYGKIAFRTAERIEVPEDLEEAVISTLKKLGYTECIETRERLDKNSLKRLSDGDLVRCGIRRTREDHFRVDPDLNLISQRIGKNGLPAPVFSVDLEKLAKAVKHKEGAAAEDASPKTMGGIA